MGQKGKRGGMGQKEKREGMGQKGERGGMGLGKLLVKNKKWSQTSYYNSPQCLIGGNVPCLIQSNLNSFRYTFQGHMPM